MRLLNTKSLRFEEFFANQVPQYAILSHRWGDDEVTFQDLRKGRKRDSQGYAKIKRCCYLADERGFHWVWIDTCCIDKKSSAELSEAINSISHWYHGAGECYAYLADVVWDFQNVGASKMKFMESKWFTRGWTLQELLAPSTIIFLDEKWRAFGARDMLSTEISAATGIKQEHLDDWSGASIATKMSWVSRRVTSRVEDLAYCMLGLFDVNMPLLYGEGEKAFVRLQLEIIKKSDDESIFAWTTKPSSQTFVGMLAPRPDCFAQSADIRIHPHLLKKRFPYAMTNQGLEFQAPYGGIFSTEGERFNVPDEEISIALNCWRKGLGRPLSVTIKLAKHGNFWRRMEYDRLGLSDSVQFSVGDIRAGKGSMKTTALLHIPQPGR